jgi:hypothetical protein
MRLVDALVFAVICSYSVPGHMHRWHSSNIRMHQKSIRSLIGSFLKYTLFYSASMRSHIVSGLFLTVSATCTATSIARRDVSINQNPLGSYAYQGCYNDSTSNRKLSKDSYYDYAQMTETSCVSYCQAKGYPVAGLEYAHEVCNIIIITMWLSLLVFTAYANAHSHTHMPRYFTVVQVSHRLVMGETVLL